MPKWTVPLAILVMIAGSVYGQGGRGGVDWTTTGNDAQRSNWVKADPKISLESMRKPGFGFLWKVKLANSPSAPVLIDRYIGYRGFRSLAFAGTASDKIFALDTDLGRIEWQMQLKSAASQAATAPCPGGMTSALSRRTSTAFTAAGAGGGGRGRGGPAKSGVGDPGQGAVTLAAAPAPARGGAPADATGGRRGGGGGGRLPEFVYVLTSDGMFHSMYISNGVESEAAIPFVPANANAQGLIVIDEVAYVATVGGCGGVADAVWALDLSTKKVASWKPASGKIAGTAGPAFGPDGTVYVTTTGGELAALEARSLKPKSFAAKQNEEFTSSPVIFEFKGKTLLAATTKSGARLIDAADLSVGAPGTIPANAMPGALAAWQDNSGVQWLLVPTGDVLTALRVTDNGGKPSLGSGWISRELNAAMTPMVVNGVVFAVSGGGARRNARGVLYALDGTSGKELWNSGATVTSAAHTGGLSAGASQMYVGTSDGTLYAFGFPIEH